MSKVRFSIDEAQAVPEGILIKKMSVIDAISGETLRIVNLNKELAEFFTHIEINMDRYFEIQKLKEQNPAVKTLIHTFKLHT